MAIYGCNVGTLLLICFLVIVALIFLISYENKELVEFGETREGMIRGLIRNEVMANSDGGICKQSYGHYGGPLWTKADETVGRKCLLESPRMRVDHHTRRLPNGDLIDDWLWVDYGDRVNVLVRERASNGGEGSFVVLEQTKYALVGSSLSVVGGFIEPHETAEDAALREVSEELGLLCDRRYMKALGKYRTDVNRGLGWVNGFLVEDCTHIGANAGGDVADADGKQELQTVTRLSLSELKEAVMGGRFVEVQWTAAVSLALLHLNNKQ